METAMSRSRTITRAIPLLVGVALSLSACATAPDYDTVSGLYTYNGYAEYPYDGTDGGLDLDFGGFRRSHDDGVFRHIHDDQGFSHRHDGHEFGGHAEHGFARFGGHGFAAHGGFGGRGGGGHR
jgi:hypothetical protein